MRLTPQSVFAMPFNNAVANSARSLIALRSFSHAYILNQSKVPRIPIRLSRLIIIPRVLPMFSSLRWPENHSSAEKHVSVAGSVFYRVAPLLSVVFFLLLQAVRINVIRTTGRATKERREQTHRFPLSERALSRPLLFPNTNRLQFWRDE